MPPGRIGAFPAASTAAQPPGPANPDAGNTVATIHSPLVPAQQAHRCTCQTPPSWPNQAASSADSVAPPLADVDRSIVALTSEALRHPGGPQAAACERAAAFLEGWWGEPRPRPLPAGADRAR